MLVQQNKEWFVYWMLVSTSTPAPAGSEPGTASGYYRAKPRIGVRDRPDGRESP